jgi:cytochrome b561
MYIRNTTSTYGVVAKFFHWLIFLLLFSNITFGFFLDSIPKDWQGFSYNLHKLIGLSILALMVLRLLWALTNPKPALPFNTKPWERWAERLVHWFLYLVVFLIPITGWVGSVAAGHPPQLGDFKFDLPITPDKALVDTSFELHEVLAITLIVLFSIHVLAALYHHYIRKDDILRRMLPSCSR